MYLLSAEGSLAMLPASPPPGAASDELADA